MMTSGDPFETNGGFSVIVNGVAGAANVFCRLVPVFGSTIVTVAPPTVTVAFVYVPAGTVTVASGVVVPARLEISIVVGAFRNATVAPESEVSVICVIVRLRDATRSPGSSPKLTCTTDAVTSRLERDGLPSDKGVSAGTVAAAAVVPGGGAVVDVEVDVPLAVELEGVVLDVALTAVYAVVDVFC